MPSGCEERFPWSETGDVLDTKFLYGELCQLLLVL